MKDLNGKLRKSLLALLIGAEINGYATEEAAMGHLNQGETAHVTQYLYDLGYEDCDLALLENFTDGTALDKNRVLRPKDTPDFYRRYFFNFCSSCILDGMPCEEQAWGEDGMYKFTEPTRKYLNELYTLFDRILETDIQFDPQRSSSFRTENRIEDCIDIGIMLEDIMMKKIKAGDKVGKYLKNLDYIPYFTLNLIDGNPKRARLRCDDVNSLDYKLAFISAFAMRSSDNASIIEQKSRRLKELGVD